MMIMACSLPPRILLLFLAAATFFLTDCGGNSSGARFYTLTSLDLPEKAGQAAGGEETVILRIGPVQIPDYLDRPQIVTRTAANKISLGDFDLWGGSLKADVERVLVENLSVLLAKDHISTVGWKSRYSTPASVPVRLDRFDAAPGDKVVLKARWGILGKGGRVLEPLRDITVSSTVKGFGYGDVVAGMSDALVGLSRDIAAGIKSVMTKRRASGESPVVPCND
jgi:uncharacterized lipoprotein YmbA